MTMSTTGARARLGALIARKRFAGPDVDRADLDRQIAATRREVDELPPSTDPAGGTAAGRAEALRRFGPRQ
jgi:hypothetical protein